MTRPVFDPDLVDELDVWVWNAHLGCPPDRLRTTLALERVDADSYFSLAGWAVQTLLSHGARVKGVAPAAEAAHVAAALEQVRGVGCAFARRRGGGGGWLN